MLRIAVQKSGRLSDETLKLIEECSIRIGRNNNKLLSPATNFPAEILFFRDDDIPGYVADGVADIGIAGLNVILEKQKDVEIIEKLGFGKCRLSIAIPRDKDYSGTGSLTNKNIATSYPRILQKYLDEKQVTAAIHEISGSVEISTSVGLSDAICDLVSSGSTLLSNGLREVETVLESEAVMISKPGLNGRKGEILKQLLFRIRAVKEAKNNRYILLNAPNDSIEKIIKILPGIKSPTILPLATEGWSSLHSVVNEQKFWEITEQLKEAGAQGILVIPIEKMVS